MMGSETSRPFPDDQLEDRINRLHESVKTWAEQNDLWHDVCFKRAVKSFDMKTGAPVVTTISADGPLAELVVYPGMGSVQATEEAQRLSDECERIIEGQGFYGEPFNAGRLDIIPLEHYDPVVFEQFKEYMRWKWICSMIQGDFDALSAELYQYFGKNSDQLTRLSWRDFEKLVAELLKARGFQTELGPGSADGGVDIRLIQPDPIGDILTLVQVKRYKINNRINLQAVQALHGAKVAEGAPNSMFVTTSDYQATARSFAARENVRMKLYVSDDVRKWCEEATTGIIEDSTRVTTDAEIIKALNEARSNPERIIHAGCGYSMRYNKFCLVLKESAGSGLVIDLPTQIIQHDGYKQAGTEVPDLSSDRKVLCKKDSAKRLKKRSRDSTYRFTDVDEELEFYITWNQEPAEFYSD